MAVFHYSVAIPGNGRYSIIDTPGSLLSTFPYSYNQSAMVKA
jgi:hypothetical protein